jgi:hypothetical protein
MRLKTSAQEGLSELLKCCWLREEKGRQIFLEKRDEVKTLLLLLVFLAVE